MNLRVCGLVVFLLAHTFVEGSQEYIRKLQKEIETPTIHRLAHRLDAPKAPADDLNNNGVGDLLPLRPILQRELPVETFSGIFGVTWAGAGPNPAPYPIYHLITLVGGVVQDYLELILEDKDKRIDKVLKLSGEQVLVTGILEDGLVTVQTITEAPTIPARRQMERRELNHILGDHPKNPTKTLVILCKFSDIADEPRDQNYYEDMMEEQNLYWQEASYGSMSLTTTVLNWGTMASPLATYLDPASGEVLKDQQVALFRDCLNVADPVVNFGTDTFDVVVFIFNADLDGRSRGGRGWTFTRDSATQTVGALWMSYPNSDDHDYLAHEFGHAIGLPHSSGAYGDDYDSEWDVMSKSSVSNDPLKWTCTAAERDPNFGCFAMHTMGWHKDVLGWIPAGRRANPSDIVKNQIVDLERLALPTGSGNLYALIAILGTGTDFYAVDCRAPVGQYDRSVPANAVVIHRVDTTRNGDPGLAPAQVVDNTPADKNPNDAGGQWLPGETMSGEGGVSIGVCSVTNTRCRIIVNPTSSAPIAKCRDITKDIDLATGTYNLKLGDVDDGSYDPDCLDNPTVTVELIVPGGNPVLPPGTTTVTVKITDSSGLTDDCTADVTVTVPNRPPVTADDFAKTRESIPVTIDILNNDSDPDGDALVVDSCTNPSHGTVVNNGGASVTYTPNLAYTGIDSFTCTVCDPQPLCDTGTVDVEIKCFFKCILALIASFIMGVISAIHHMIFG